VIVGWIGHAPHIPTVYGAVSQAVTGWWRKRGWDVLFCLPGDDGDKLRRCDVLVINAPVRAAAGAMSDLASLRGLPPVVAWVTVSGVGVCFDRDGLESLASTTLIATTEMGAKELLEAGVNDEVGVLPFGVSRSFTADGGNLRNYLELPDDAFLVVNADKNDALGRIDLTVDGFCRFAAEYRDKPVYLFLQTAPHGETLVRACFQFWADAYGLKPGRTHLFIGEDAGGLNWADLYRSADVVTTTSGDCGWNQALLDGAACGAGVVVPDFAFQDIWEGYAAPVKIGGFVHRGGWCHPVVDSADLALTLSALYQYPDVCKRCRQQSQERAEAYRWEKVLAGIDEVLCDLVGSRGV